MSHVEEIRRLWLTATTENPREHMRRAQAIAEEAGDDGGYLEGLSMLFMAMHPGESVADDGPGDQRPPNDEGAE